MKHILLTFILFLPLLIEVQGQDYTSASPLITKSWVDKNGENNLQIITAVYNPLDDYYTIIGDPTQIEAKLQNSKYTSYLKSDDNIDLIMFDEDFIWFHEMNGIKAVFIPFFYCCMDNTYIRVSYFVFYNKKKYLYHFDFLCEEDTNYFPVLINEDKDLDKKLKKMPRYLREILKEYVISKYKTIHDIFPQIIIGQKRSHIN